MTLARRIWPVLFAFLLLPACDLAGSAEPPKPETAPVTEEPAPARAENGLALYDVTSAGFSLGVPEAWASVSADDVARGLGGALEELAVDNPVLEPFVEAMQAGNSPVRFFAFDPALRGGFATNVNVAVEPIHAAIGLAAYERANLRQLRALVDGRLERGKATVAAGPARTIRFVGALGSDAETATLQYYLVGEGQGYVITYTTLPRLLPRYEKAFKRSARSFRFLEPSS